jgi:transposase
MLATRKMQAVIPSKRNRTRCIPHDPVLYKTRNRIERTFQRCKANRRFVTRFDRRLHHFSSLVAISCSLIWLNQLNVD